MENPWLLNMIVNFAIKGWFFHFVIQIVASHLSFYFAPLSCYLFNLKNGIDFSKPQKDWKVKATLLDNLYAVRAQQSGAAQTNENR